MFHVKSDHFARLLLLLDVVVSALVYLVVLNVYPRIHLGMEGGADYFSHVALLVLILAVFTGVRIWSNRRLTLVSVATSAVRLCKDWALTVAICASLIFLLKLDFASRAVVVGFLVIDISTLIALRIFLVWWYFERNQQHEESFLKILIVGSGRRARILADHLQHELDWGVSIVGFLDPEGRSAGRRKEDEILGSVSQVSEVLRDNVVDEVIVAVPRTMIDNLQDIIDACQEEGVKLRFMADLYDFKAARTQLVMASGVPLLTFEPVAMPENALIAKRFFDLVITIAAIPILLPLFALIALVIKLDSRGPVFFTQRRVGLHKRRFKMFKFRSMVSDAEARMKEIEHLNEVEGPNFKIKDDPRITGVGRILRRSSLDELPQLINVLAGDMSLVGPRPMSLRDVDLFDKGIQRKRFSVRPGITCIWQSSGRSNLDFQNWLRLDLQYIDSWSFWLDIKILLKTIPSVIKGGGAV